jgi:nitrite reductase/ring-hydroxylating ferredoxin subunit
MAWIDVLDESRLPEGAREVVEVNGAPVLLIRHGGEIFAVAARCPHMGAPLKNGRITEDGHLVCPWHRSAFSLRTGDVADGPPGHRGWDGSWARCAGSTRSPSTRSGWRTGASWSAPTEFFTAESAEYAERYFIK